MPPVKNLNLYRGDTHYFEFVLSGLGDVGGATVVMDIVPGNGGQVLKPKLTVRGQVVEVLFDSRLTHDLTWQLGNYDMRAIWGGMVKTIAKGTVTISQSVTPVSDRLGEGGSVRREAVLLSAGEPPISILPGLSPEDAEQRIAAVERRLDELGAAVADAEESPEVARLLDTVQQLQTQLQQALLTGNADVGQIRRQLAAVETALAQSGGLEARLQALESGKQQAEVLAVELASLKQQLADKAQSSAIDECKQLIRQAQSDLEQRLRQLQSGGQVSSSEIAALDQRVQQLETQLRELQRAALAGNQVGNPEAVAQLQQRIEAVETQLAKIAALEADIQQLRGRLNKPKMERIHLRQDVWSNGGYPWTTVQFANSYTQPELSYQIVHKSLNVSFLELNYCNLTGSSVQIRSNFKFESIDVDYVVHLTVREGADV